MEPKFILTLDGHLRIGSVKMHKDLLQPGDTCIGGGFWEVDYLSRRLILSGKSYDYGKPKWTFVTEEFMCQRISADCASNMTATALSTVSMSAPNLTLPIINRHDRNDDYHQCQYSKTYCAIAAVYLATLLAVVAIWGYTPCNDSNGYIELARQSIAYGEPYPCWPTIYGKPFIWNIGQINLIALSLWTTGSIMPVVVLMCVMKATTALLVATTGRKLFGPYAGLAAIVLFVLYPNNWGQSTMILSEIPAITFAMTAVAMMVGEGSGTTKNNSNYGPFKDNKGLGHSKNVLKTVPWRAMAAGALLALANWFRSISLVFLVAFFLYYLIFSRRQIISRFVPLMVGYVAFIIIVGTSCWMRTDTLSIRVIRYGSIWRRQLMRHQ